MAGADVWIEAVRRSHDGLAATVAPLSAEQVTEQSYDDKWTIADVASHLGSQAEIFEMFLAAGLRGEDPPGGDAFGAIWDLWNSLSPVDQVANSVSANEEFVARLEGMSAEDKDSFTLTMFGTTVDLGGMLAMRLGEHAIHAWDIAVALDPGALVAADSVNLLIDTFAANAGRFGKPAAQPRAVVVETTDPARRFAVTTGPEVSVADDASGEVADLSLPAEALLRAVYGRLDPDHTPAAVGDSDVVAHLRTVFPGF